jgi:multiple sugar transport system permease protein
MKQSEARASAPVTFRRRSKVRVLLGSLVYWLVLLGLAATFFAPFLWMVATSLISESQMAQASPTELVWIPKPMAWANYPRALTSFPFLLYLRNTLFICLLTVIGTLFSCALPAYGFSLIRWRGRDAVFLLVLSTIMLPSVVIMLPMFVLFRALGWTNTFLPLVVPPFFGSAFYIFMLRQFFMTLPLELSDAARLDGCGDFSIFWRVVVPLTKPALATVALFTFIGAWMDFMGPLIYLNDERLYTLALGLLSFLGKYSADWSGLMAASTVVILPIIILFFFTQRTFIKGIVLTGIKG